MSKFTPGQTSDHVIKTKIRITDSLKKKSSLIEKINSHEDIISSLKIKGDRISELAVFRWEDDNLDIVKCSRNTAYSIHNKHVLEVLKRQIELANSRLAKNVTPLKKKSNPKRASISDEVVRKIKLENEELRVALAEVYRAYIQTLERLRENRVTDDSLRRLLMDQAAVLGRNRLREIK